MQVSRPDRQHDVMIEAVENHMPEAIIVDEIGTSAEASAARTIAERGVQLVATAHGNTLENLVLNPTLSDLVGGVHVVTLSDEEARRRHTQKTVSERRAPPTFDVVVEMATRDEVLVHRDTAQAVDRLLAGERVGGERRQLVDGQVAVLEAAPAPEPQVEFNYLGRFDLGLGRAPGTDPMTAAALRRAGDGGQLDTFARDVTDLVGWFGPEGGSTSGLRAIPGEGTQVPIWMLGSSTGGAQVAAALGLPVPPGFTITTEVCTHYYANGETYPVDLEAQVRAALQKAGFYGEWKGKYGDEAWAILERSVGRALA